MKAKPVRTAAEIARLDGEALLTIKEVQDYLCISRSYIDRLCTSGKLQKHYVGTSVRFYMRDIRALIQ